jgi:hypothetical protein
VHRSVSVAENSISEEQVIHRVFVKHLSQFDIEQLVHSPKFAPSGT